MKALVVFLVLAASLSASQPNAPISKQERASGRVSWVDQSRSSFGVINGRLTTTVVYNAATTWTATRRAANLSQLSKGMYVVVIGHTDTKKGFTADRVDLRGHPQIASRPGMR